MRTPIDCDNLLEKLEHLQDSVQDLKQDVKKLAAAPADQSPSGTSQLLTPL